MADLQLLVTDLDGTLWDGDQVVHDRTVAALRELERREVPLLVATGRRRRSAQQVLATVGIAPPAVLLDGALGYHLATGEAFHREAFVPADAAAVLEGFLAEGLEPCVYVEDHDIEILIGDAPDTHPRHLAAVGESARTADLREAVVTETVVSFGIVAGDPVRLQRVVDRLLEAGAGHPRLSRDVVHGAETLMVPPHGVSKWDGVTAYCELVGIDADRIIAIGDGENDVELLRRARVACAVRDGCDAVLDLAHHVVGGPREGGWADVLELL